MLFTLQGSPIRILDESPDDLGGNPPNGGPDADTGVAAENNPDKTTPAGDGDTGDKGIKDVSAQTPPSTETTTSEPAKDTKPSQPDPEDADPDETIRKGKLANQNRTLTRQNEGLKDQLKSMGEVDKELDAANAKIAVMENANMKLELAGKYGVEPSMLEPMVGTKKELEAWLRKYTSKPEIAPETTMETETTKPTSTPDPEATTTPAPQTTTRVVTQPIDGDRPKSSGDKEFVDTKQMPAKEAREILEKQI